MKLQMWSVLMAVFVNIYLYCIVGMSVLPLLYKMEVETVWVCHSQCLFSRWHWGRSQFLLYFIHIHGCHCLASISNCLKVNSFFTISCSFCITNIYCLYSKYFFSMTVETVIKNWRKTRMADSGEYWTATEVCILQLYKLCLFRGGESYLPSVITVLIDWKDRRWHPYGG